MSRRLIDLDGMAELERRALMAPRLADEDARDTHPELDALSRALFGITADDADATARPAGWDGIDRRPLRDQVEAFEREGWDVTDDRRRPLRTLSHFHVALWLAIRGVAGRLPFTAPPTDEGSSAWEQTLRAQAKRFRQDRR